MPAPWRLRLQAIVAGFVDTVGYVQLAGIFVAHVTGNMVLIGADVSSQDAPSALSRLLVLPVFTVGVALAWLATHASREIVVRRLLWAEAILVAIFAGAGMLVIDRGSGTPGVWTMLAVAVPGVFAMTAQSSRRRAEGGPPTQVMTSNLTGATFDVMQAVREWRHGQSDLARRRAAWNGAALVGSFLLGAISAGMLLPTMGFATLAIPVALLVLLATTVPSGAP
jgi:uncharacterized membrane protein YoaK (UPF0700 family)